VEKAVDKVAGLLEPFPRYLPRFTLLLVDLDLPVPRLLEDSMAVVKREQVQTTKAPAEVPVTSA
jgi:hypothetical protein